MRLNYDRASGNRTMVSSVTWGWNTCRTTYTPIEPSWITYERDDTTSTSVGTAWEALRRQREEDAIWHDNVDRVLWTLYVLPEHVVAVGGGEARVAPLKETATPGEEMEESEALDSFLKEFVVKREGE